MNHEKTTRDGATKSLRLLVVEDSPQDAEIAVREIRRGGFDVTWKRAETAEAMRAALQEKTWDVILCDYQMPQFSGLAAIALLKETGIDIPLIVVSGVIGEDTAVECMRSGAHDYIMKSNLFRLVPAIERELKEAESRKERKLAEEALLIKDQALESSINAIALSGLDGKLTYVNPAFLQMWGVRDRREVEGRSAIDFWVSPDEAALVMTALQKTGQWSGELKAVNKDKGAIDLELQACMILDRDGGPTGMFASFQDITGRKRAEEMLRESEIRYRTLFQASSDGILIADLETKSFRYANPAVCRLLGYSVTELTTMGVAAIHPKADLPRVMAEFEAQSRGDKTLAVDLPCLRKDGTIVYADVVAGAITIDGRACNVGFFRDITERKRAEEKLAHLNRHNERILSSAAEGILGLDLQGNHTFVNPAAARMLGYEAEELLGRPSHSAWHHTKPDGSSYPREECNIYTAYRDGSVHRKSTEVFWRKDGTCFPVEYASTPIHENGRLEGAVVTFADITARKTAEERLNETLRLLRQAMASTIQVLGLTVEARDPYTAGHQQRTTILAEAIAREMGLPTEKIEGLHMAGLTHDVGKISIPAEILSKPTTLTATEYKLVKTHAQKGYEILKDVVFPWPLAEIVYQHHERMDGSGYPRGLKGEEILMEARILSLADTVEAMVSHRPYRPAQGPQLALAEVEKNKGILYDAVVAETCLKLFREKRFSFPA